MEAAAEAAIKAKAHPRIRGEYVGRLGTRASYLGSPPHTRGIFQATINNNWKSGLTPAYAGNMFPEVHPIANA